MRFHRHSDRVSRTLPAEPARCLGTGGKVPLQPRQRPSASAGPASGRSLAPSLSPEGPVLGLGQGAGGGDAVTRLLILSDGSRAWRACDNGGLLPVRRAAQDGLCRASIPSDPLSSRRYIHFHFLGKTAFSLGFRARLRACPACSSFSSSALLGSFSRRLSEPRSGPRASVQRCLGSRGRHSASPRLPAPRGFSLHQPRPRPSRAAQHAARGPGAPSGGPHGDPCTWGRVVAVPSLSACPGCPHTRCPARRAVTEPLQGPGRPRPRCGREPVRTSWAESPGPRRTPQRAAGGGTRETNRAALSSLRPSLRLRVSPAPGPLQ